MNTLVNIASKQRARNFIILLLFSALGYFGNNIAGDMLELVPRQVVYGSELWRLLSFPLTTSNVFTYVLFAFVALVIIPKLRDFFAIREITILSALILALQGVLFSMLFSDTMYRFSGIDALSFYFIFLFAGFSYFSGLRLLKVKGSRTTLHALLVVILWSCYLLFLSPPEVMYSHLYSAVFGIVVSAVSFAFIKVGIIRRKKKLQEEDDFSNRFAKELEEAEEKEIPVYEFANTAREYMRNNQSTSEDILGSTSYYKFQASEDTLNQILDKISSRGQDSLTYNERRYLEDYSNYLK